MSLISAESASQDAMQALAGNSSLISEITVVLFFRKLICYCFAEMSQGLQRFPLDLPQLRNKFEVGCDCVNDLTEFGEELLGR
ncbi:hypothetical protein TSAR_006210 [Trichomalopsis sarcophagae]|uniref:Uncharacterized protein n=1 Tax=Trichomalopsis sarcophagae TaxID=543379 RepID=A0A232EL52_9HYME|nr:hypothetical protein TSAR_006210 [Trichomalopsis sarcophagae]